MIFLRTNWPTFVYKVTFLLYEMICRNASVGLSIGSKIFAGTGNGVPPRFGATTPLTVQLDWVE